MPMENELADEDPDEKTLWNHPIHGHGWVDEEGYLNVDGYPRRFIRAIHCPPAMWPVNARDWGFVQWLASQTDMTPRPGGPQHPAIVMVGRQERVGLADSGVNAAFYYT
jgi:hypothetical protein